MKTKYWIIPIFLFASIHFHRVFLLLLVPFLFISKFNSICTLYEWCHTFTLHCMNVLYAFELNKPTSTLYNVIQFILLRFVHFLESRLLMFFVLILVLNQLPVVKNTNTYIYINKYNNTLKHQPKHHRSSAMNIVER